MNPNDNNKWAREYLQEPHSPITFHYNGAQFFAVRDANTNYYHVWLNFRTHLRPSPTFRFTIEQINRRDIVPIPELDLAITLYAK